MNVIAFSIETMVAVLDDGTQVPITNLLDDDGDECTADAAVVFVCGSDATGWCVERMCDYETRSVLH